ncbi:intraflagellar transport protein 22 homolog [Orussus abietinus]|uniref:intraflagellar transport protein 22 homolog n=1 Tax=Orussus abietinus TaxID=222816 RepID=UPI0006269575|nr:intraflagellar transport protein 22 homolog [Orussus abietinus]
MQVLKLVVVGPVGAGKSTISNFLADATEMSPEYRPTKGVRILEFEAQNCGTKAARLKVDIELWDCSGDHKYEFCWPAMRRDAHGVIFVYNEKSQDYPRELEQLYDYFVNQTRLGPNACVVLYFDPENDSPEAPKKLPSTFAKVAQVSCNVQESGEKLKRDFQSYLGTLVTRLQEHTDQEENNIVEDNILLVK